MVTRQSPLHPSGPARSQRFSRVLLCYLWGLMVMLCACEARHDTALDPNTPVTVTLWSYGGEPMQQSMGPLVNLFNEETGRKAGVFVEVVYYNDPRNLDDDVLNAASGTIGSLHPPDMFCGYPETVARVDATRKLLDLNTRLSPEEKQQFFAPFVEYATVEDRWLLFPVSKSTEALFVNKKAWERFATATGHPLEALRTWEGLVSTSEAYYAWTDARTPLAHDGQAFMSVDFPFYQLLMAAKQLDSPLFTRENGKTVFHFERELARKVWNLYYVPHMKGTFNNDYAFTVYNIRQGTTIAGVTSTAFGGLQFPATLAANDEPIESFVLPYPLFATGKPYAPLRGGQDVAVFAGTEQQEQACLLFLRWFTESDRNIGFNLPKGYLPVKTTALTAERMDIALAALPPSTGPLASKVALDMLQSYTMFRNKPFAGDAQVEQILKRHLPDWIKRDQRELEDRLAKGEPRELILADLASEEHFEVWYLNLVHNVQNELNVHGTR